MEGKAIKFVDEWGVEHDALVTRAWTGGSVEPDTCSVNLVYVSDDPSKTDQYGVQIERRTSVVHESKQAAHGMFWRQVA